MLKECPICKGKVEKATRKILIRAPNPGQLLIEAECGECKSCGEKFFDEKQSKVLATRIDVEIKRLKEKEPCMIPSGTLIV